MPEYAKMKNADLEALLKDRGLPTGGKKADMVDRLTKDDEKKADAPSKLHPEDEIDWDDEGEEGSTEATKTAPAAPVAKATEPTAPAATTQSKTTTTAKAGTEDQPNKSQADPTQKADIEPSTTDDLSVKPPIEGNEASTEEKKTPAVDYTKGLAATNLEEEIEKRRKRAEKFGLKIDEDENLKKLERAKKFGEVGPPKGLDDALPERQERRKRGRDDNDDSGRNKRRGGGRFGGRGGRGGHRDGDRRRDERDNRGPRDNRDNRRDGNWMSEADRKKADERRAKWARPAAAS